ncbi:MAG: hypothetical protein ABL924_10500 [Methyloglobulus sp.]
MAEEQVTTITSEKKQRLLSIFERLLPLVDSLADKLRLFLILGILVTLWLVVWCHFLKHYSLSITVTLGIAAFFPTLILARFWWALEELKNLPDIAGQVVGDAKTELQESVQNIRAGKVPKVGFFSAGKSLWSVGAMASEARELVGSYISISTLVNPFMLVLGVISFVSVFLLFLLGIMLVFFV